ncbi:MAG: hypothetical protein ABIR57_12030, partial [Aeromicrobium sp.]
MNEAPSLDPGLAVLRAAWLEASDETRSSVAGFETCGVHPEVSLLQLLLKSNGVNPDILLVDIKKAETETEAVDGSGAGEDESPFGDESSSYVLRLTR